MDGIKSDRHLKTEETVMKGVRNGYLSNLDNI